jgi:hypothetical protein
MKYGGGVGKGRGISNLKVAMLVVLVLWRKKHCHGVDKAS